MSRTILRISRLATAGALSVALSVALAALAGGIAPGVADAAAHAPATGVPSLAGTWNFEGGVFKFAKNSKGQFVDTVVKQRPGVFCPSVNDKNGQIVLTQQRHDPREYKGTWKWFFTGSCSFAGDGATTITLSASGKTAQLVSDPPSGLGGSVEVSTITRVG
jgi:hypothetical protein